MRIRSQATSRTADHAAARCQNPAAMTALSSQCVSEYTTRLRSSKAEWKQMRPTRWRGPTRPRPWVLYSPPSALPQPEHLPAFGPTSAPRTAGTVQHSLARLQRSTCRIICVTVSRFKDSTGTAPPQQLPSSLPRRPAVPSSFPCPTVRVQHSDTEHQNTI